MMIVHTFVDIYFPMMYVIYHMEWHVTLCALHSYNVCCSWHNSILRAGYNASILLYRESSHGMLISMCFTQRKVLKQF